MTVKEFCSYCIDDELPIKIYSYEASGIVWEGTAGEVATDMPTRIENSDVDSVQVDTDAALVLNVGR